MDRRIREDCMGRIKLGQKIQLGKLFKPRACAAGWEGNQDWGWLDGSEGEVVTKCRKKRDRGGKSKSAKAVQELEPIQVNCV